MSDAKTTPAPSSTAPRIEVLSFKAPKAPKFSTWEIALASLGEPK